MSYGLPCTDELPSPPYRARNPSGAFRKSCWRRPIGHMGGGGACITGICAFRKSCWRQSTTYTQLGFSFATDPAKPGAPTV